MDPTLIRSSRLTGTLQWSQRLYIGLCSSRSLVLQHTASFGKTDVCSGIRGNLSHTRIVQIWSYLMVIMWGLPFPPLRNQRFQLILQLGHVSMDWIMDRLSIDITPILTRMTSTQRSKLSRKLRMWTLWCRLAPLWIFLSLAAKHINILVHRRMQLALSELPQVIFQIIDGQRKRSLGRHGFKLSTMILCTDLQLSAKKKAL